MNPIKTIIVAAALSTLAIATAQAEQTMKPMQGVSFHSGTKHAVAYFLTETKACKLVVTSADDANFEPARYEAVIEVGVSKSYQLAAGKALEFACQAEGKVMKVKPLVATVAN
jgi:hypothetical protein